VLVGETELPEPYRPGTSWPGIYTIVYIYGMVEEDIDHVLLGLRLQQKGQSHENAPPPFWLGRIQSEPITITRSWLP